MDTATSNLENDHVYILKLIDVIDRIVKTDNPVVSHIEKIVDLVRNFADGLHHAKEENLLFPLLEEKGFSSTQGPVAVMLLEHQQGRNFVKGIAENLSLYKGGDNSTLGELYFNMKGYAELLRNHIQKENNILFPMADRVLSQSDNLNLLGKFVETDEKGVSSAISSVEYIEQINELGLFYKK